MPAARHESSKRGANTATRSPLGTLPHSLDVTGTTVTSVPFEGFEGISYEVSGTIDDTTIDRQAVGGGETITATGTLTRDANGTPTQINGTLSDGGNFFTYGCRLN